MNERIANLVALYYQCLVDHHKDRDCHWVITVDYQYSGEVEYVVEHNGYVYNRVYKAFDSLDEAEEYMMDKLIDAITKELEFVRLDYPEIYDSLVEEAEGIL